MTFRSTAVFSCDGCKVIDSDEIEVNTDIMQARPPVGWLRCETHRLIGEPEGLTEMRVRFYCPHCAPMIESYLAGRSVPPTDARDETRKRIQASLHRWRIKATATLGSDAVEEIINEYIDGKIAR